MKTKSKNTHLLRAILCAAFAISVAGQAQAQLLVNPDALWLRPGVGLTGTSGNYSAWQSQAASPGNYNLTPNIPSNFTSTTMGSGNATAMNFGGSGLFQIVNLTGPMLNVFSGGATVSLAFSPTTKAGVQRLMDTTNQSNNGWELYWNAGKIGFSQRFSTTSASWETAAGSFAAGGNYVMTLTYSSDSASNVPTIYLNDSTTALTLTQVGSNSGTATSDPNRFRLGARNSNTPGSEDYLGKMGDVLVYNSVLSGGDLTSVQNTLYNTYVVPEPSSIALLSLGVGALLLRRRSIARRAKSDLA